MAVAVKKRSAQSAARARGALYLYGVSPAKGAGAKIAAMGVDGKHPLAAFKAGKVVAWVSEVDGPEFAAQIERNMENLDWLAEVTLRHQQVVNEIFRRKIALLPARFGTIFSSATALEADLRARRAELTHGFKRIMGASEWGVKVFRHAQAPTALIEAKSGKDYLQKKARVLDARPAADAEIDRFRDELMKVARAAAPTGKVSGAQPGLQWQGTFLVPLAGQKQWDAVLRKYAQRWGETRSIESTGPWPPYSFVSE